MRGVDLLLLSFEYLRLIAMDLCWNDITRTSMLVIHITLLW
jgi:hypothetical protein